jgi:hypothetical protein
MARNLSVGASALFHAALRGLKPGSLLCRLRGAEAPLFHGAAGGHGVVCGSGSPKYKSKIKGDGLRLLWRLVGRSRFLTGLADRFGMTRMSLSVLQDRSA